MKPIYRAVAVVTMLAFSTRVLAFLFKIYLSHQLTDTAMGIYQVALSVFFFMLTLVASGVPLVVGKLTARFRAQKKVVEEGRYVAAALVITTVASFVLSAGVLVSYPLTKGLFPSPESAVCLLLLLPALISSSVACSFRGALWGQGRYAANGVLEIIEQGLRIALCVLFLLFGSNKLRLTALTFSLACVVSALATIVYFFVSGGRLGSPKKHYAPILVEAVPITAVRASSSLIGFLLAFAIPMLFGIQGLSSAESMALLGASLGLAFPLLYIPNTIVGSLAYVLVPTLTKSVATKSADLPRQIESAVSFSIIVAAMFIPAFMALGKPIGILLFDNATTGEFISYSAWLLIPIAVESITSSMMNSLGLEGRGLLNYFLGAALMFGVMFAFIGNFSLHVFSIAFGLSLCLSSVLDITAIYKKTSAKPVFLFPLIICGFCVPVVSFLTKYCYSLLQSVSVPLSAGIKEFVCIAISCTLGFIFFGLILIVFDIIKLDKIKLSKNNKKIPAPA